MYRTVIAVCLLVSGWANALTLSPMYKDELVYNSFYTAVFRLDNTSTGVMYYDVWVGADVNKLEPEDGLYVMGTVLGGKDYKNIFVPMPWIEENKLEVYYVCIQEKPLLEGFSAVGRVCAKLRLYWPLAELQTLQ